jgi:hypothetical protein
MLRSVSSLKLDLLFERSDSESRCFRRPKDALPQAAVNVATTSHSKIELLRGTDTCAVLILFGAGGSDSIRGDL